MIHGLHYSSDALESMCKMGVITAGLPACWCLHLHSAICYAANSLGKSKRRVDDRLRCDLTPFCFGAMCIPKINFMGFADMNT